MAPSPSSKPTSHKSPPAAQRKDSTFTKHLLSRAHSDTETTRILTDKIAHKPLTLYATRLPSSNTSTSTPTFTNARDARRAQRTAKASTRRTKTLTKRANAPLSAAQKRRLCLLDIPRGEQKWDLYIGLHKLWAGYMRNVLGFTTGKVTPVVAVVGPKVAAADMHGALLEVVRSRCVGRVGVKGIVVRDTKFTFVVVTRADKVRVLPKEGTVFRLVVPLEDTVEGDGGEKGNGAGEETDDAFMCELYGDQFRNRAPERATKKFRWHLPKDL